MTKMTVIAEFGGWQVVFDLNSIVSIHFGNGSWVCSHASVRDAIVSEVKDHDTRRELMKQWFAYLGGSR